MAGRFGGFAEELRGELVAARLGELDDLDGEVVAAEAVDEELGLRRVRSWATMSRWTVGVAVAVRAMIGRGAQRGEVVAEGAVVGAKVVAPLRDAVGFVDGDERGLALGEHLGEAGDAHALGGDEEEVERAVEVVAAGLAGVVAGEAGVDAGDAEAERRRAWRPGRP